MFFGVLIITVVYVPILALTGIEGKMFRPMALTVIFALAGSLVLALTLMPVLCSCFLRGKIKEEDNWLVRFFKALYTPLLAWALRFQAESWSPPRCCCSARRSSSSPGWARSSFRNSTKARCCCNSSAAAAPGWARPPICNASPRNCCWKNFPEIERIFGLIGTAEIAVDPMGPNLCDTYVEFKPRQPMAQDRRAARDQGTN